MAFDISRGPNGRSEKTPIELADWQTPGPPRQKAQAAFLLPQVQHGSAAARRLPQLRLLYGPGDRGDGGGIGGTGFKFQVTGFKLCQLETWSLKPET